MRQPLWSPSEERIQQANITRFIDEVNARGNLSLGSYAELYQWSVENIPDFWAAVWDFAEIKALKPYDQVVEAERIAQQADARAWVDEVTG